MTGESPPPRHGSKNPAKRRNRPPELTPYWHKEVLEIVHEEARKVFEADLSHGHFEDVVNAHKNGELRSWFDTEIWFQIEKERPEPVLEAVDSSITFLYMPQLTETIRMYRARLRNAIGREQWEKAARFFQKLHLSLMGSYALRSPGFPPWFSKCIQLEYQATYDDVSRWKEEYRASPKERQNKLRLHEFVSRKARVRDLAEGTPRKLSLQIMASRWGVHSAESVEKWLKPSKRKGALKRGQLGTVVFLGADGEELMRFDLKNSVPKSRIGRPPRRKK